MWKIDNYDITIFKNSSDKEQHAISSDQLMFRKIITTEQYLKIKKILGVK